MNSPTDDSTTKPTTPDSETPSTEKRYPYPQMNMSPERRAEYEAKLHRAAASMIESMSQENKELDLGNIRAGLRVENEELARHSPDLPQKTNQPIYPYPSLRSLPPEPYKHLEREALYNPAVAFAVLAAWVQSNPRLATQLASQGKLVRLMQSYRTALGDAQLALAENPDISPVEAAQMQEIPLKLSEISPQKDNSKTEPTTTDSETPSTERKYPHPQMNMSPEERAEYEADADAAVASMLRGMEQENKELDLANVRKTPDSETSSTVDPSFLKRWPHLKRTPEQQAEDDAASDRMIAALKKGIAEENEELGLGNIPKSDPFDANKYEKLINAFKKVTANFEGDETQRMDALIDKLSERYSFDQIARLEPYIRSTFGLPKQEFKQHVYDNLVPRFKKALATIEETDQEKQVRAFVRRLGESSSTDTIRQMQPYIVKFFEENVLQRAVEDRKFET